MGLFGEQGLDAPSLDAICERAGYSRGAFYVHFKDRDDFLIAVMDKVGADFLAAVMHNADGARSIVATVEGFVAAVLRDEYPLMRKGGVRPHQLLAACARSPAIAARYVALGEGARELLRQQIRRGQKEGTLRSDVPPAELATMLLTAVVGVQTMMDLGVPLDLRRLAKAYLKILLVA